MRIVEDEGKLSESVLEPGLPSSEIEFRRFKARAQIAGTPEWAAVVQLEALQAALGRPGGAFDLIYQKLVGMTNPD